jgi:hypothetical protein
MDCKALIIDPRHAPIRIVFLLLCATINLLGLALLPFVTTWSSPGVVLLVAATLWTTLLSIFVFLSRKTGWPIIRILICIGGLFAAFRLSTAHKLGSYQDPAHLLTIFRFRE